MRTVGAVITEIVEEYYGRGAGWVRVADIAKSRDLTPAEMQEAIEELMTDDSFRAEEEPFGFRITEDDKRFAPIIGGDARHLIRWYE